MSGKQQLTSGMTDFFSYNLADFSDKTHMFCNKHVENLNKMSEIPRDTFKSNIIHFWKYQPSHYHNNPYFLRANHHHENLYFERCIKATKFFT
jgi:hypothetical protein